MITLPDFLIKQRDKRRSKKAKQKDATARAQAASIDHAHTSEKGQTLLAALGEAAVQQARSGGPESYELLQQVSATDTLALALKARMIGFQAESKKLIAELAEDAQPYHEALNAFVTAERAKNNEAFVSEVANSMRRLWPILATARALQNNGVYTSIKGAKLLGLDGRNVFALLNDWARAPREMHEIVAEWTRTITELRRELNEKG